MLSQSVIAGKRRGILANPNYLRLWFAGGIGNAMRWLELLVAGIFTYDVTHSAFLVAVVTVTRSLPMLFVGAIAGLVGEALNRKRILLAQLVVMAGSSAALCGLALGGRLQVWQVALAGGVTGIVWTAEMAVRRRMIGEVVASDQVGAAVAFDSLTNSIARVVGPLAGGAVFQWLGIGGAYALSATLYLSAWVVVGGLGFRQQTGPLRLHRFAADLAEGLAVARSYPAILGVVLVSIVMNVFGFSYSALIAPIAIAGFRVSPTLVGALAAAEPIGSIAIGTALSAGWLRLDGIRAMLCGSLLLLVGVVGMALSPWYGLAFGLLLIGGFGTAAFSNIQTTLILIEAPAAMRSRVMGIVTMCIGTGPLGILVAGMLSEWIGPASAILTMACLGLAGLGLVWARLLRAGAERPITGRASPAAMGGAFSPMRPAKRSAKWFL